MNKKKLERLERKVLRRDAQEAVRNTKKAKQENPLVLNAEVVGGNWRHRKLGRIFRVTKSLLHVRWDNGTTDFFGRRGQAFHGKLDEYGEAITTTATGKLIENLWGGEEDPGIEIVTDAIKTRIAEELAARTKLAADRAAKQAEIEADPRYQNRKADLERYNDLLRPYGNVETGWNDQSDFRIEIDGIKPDKMEKLVTAIQEVLK